MQLQLCHYSTGSRAGRRINSNGKVKGTSCGNWRSVFVNHFSIFHFPYRKLLTPCEYSGELEILITDGVKNNVSVAECALSLRR